MRIIYLYVFLMFLVGSCRNVSTIDSLIYELDKKFDNLKYIEYIYSDYSENEEIIYTYFTMIQKDDKKMLYFYQDGILTEIGKVEIKWFFTPTYGLQFEKINGKSQNEISVLFGDKYLKRYEMEIKPTKLLSLFKNKGHQVSLLDNKKISGLDSQGVKIIIDGYLNQRVAIMRFDRETGLLISDERYDHQGRLVASRILKKLSFSEPKLFKSVNFDDIQKVKDILINNSVKIDINDNNLKK